MLRFYVIDQLSGGKAIRPHRDSIQFLPPVLMTLCYHPLLSYNSQYTIPFNVTVHAFPYLTTHGLLLHILLLLPLLLLLQVLLLRLGIQSFQFQLAFHPLGLFAFKSPFL